MLTQTWSALETLVLEPVSRKRLPWVAFPSLGMLGRMPLEWRNRISLPLGPQVCLAGGLMRGSARLPCCRPHGH